MYNILSIIRPKSNYFVHIEVVQDIETAYELKFGQYFLENMTFKQSNYML